MIGVILNDTIKLNNYSETLLCLGTLNNKRMPTKKNTNKNSIA